MDHDEARRLAADPATPLKMLHRLAMENPEVHPLLAQNPSTYPDLLTWLSSRGDPAVNAALARRAVDRAESHAHAPAEDTQAEDTQVPTGETLQESDTAATSTLEREPTFEPDSPQPAETAAAGPVSPEGEVERHSILGRENATLPAADQDIPPAILPESYALDSILSGPEPAAPVTERRRFPPALAAILGVILLLAVLLIVWAMTRSFGDQDAASSSSQPTTAAQETTATEEASPTSTDPAETLLATAKAATCQDIDPDKVALEVYADSVEEWDADSVSTVRQALESWQTRCNAGWALEILDALGDDSLTEQLGTGWIQYARPIPSDAQELEQFSAPSGNISCSLSGSDVMCTIQSYSFTPDGGSCTAGEPVSATVGADGAELNCTLGQVTGGDALAYGSAATLGNFVCTSETTGVECYNALTGAGFLMRREGVELTQATVGG